MNNASHGTARGPSHRSVELGVAVFTALIGAITVYGSLKVGITWGAEGPRSGFFPFYIGLFILASSAINFIQARGEKSNALFAEWSQLRQVLSVVIPTAVYVVIIPYSGIYLASAVLIGLFMLWLGKYRLPLALGIAIGVPVLIYFTFEKWFLVPLPKGPIEDWLGL
ncbi:MAG: tripartite tricarboxylate transporter TctB family protein [Pseudorhodoplanes sp.]